MATSEYWQTHRLSRRRALRAAGAGLGATALALAGCGGGDDEEGTPGAGDTPAAELTPQPGGDIRFGISVDPGNLDPEQTVTGYWAGASICGFLHGIGLNDGQMYPQMAESIEQPDDLTYIWKLRQGIKYQNIAPVNGREVTAADVTYSFTRHRDDAQAQTDKQLLRDYTESFGDVDQYTFRLVTKEPLSPTLDELSGTGYPIQPKEAVEAGKMSSEPIGCGPYMLGEFRRGERVLLKKNPDYFKPGHPYLDSLEWIIIPDNSTLVQAFRTKQHDYTNATLEKPIREEMAGTEHLILEPRPNLQSKTLLVMADRPPFNDMRVREAVDLAIDRQDLIDKIAFGEGKIMGPVVPDLEYWALPQDELKELFKVDLEKSKQLLSAAGYEDGPEIEVTVEQIYDMTKYAEVVKEQLAKVGVKCNLVVKELAVYLAQHLYVKNFTMTWYQNLPYADPDRYLGNWNSKGPAGFSFCNYSNSEMDEWIRKTRSEFDREARRDLFLDAQRAMIAEHGPQYCLMTPIVFRNYWDWVHGWNSRFGGMTGAAYLYEDLWLSARA